MKPQVTEGHRPSDRRRDGPVHGMPLGVGRPTLRADFTRHPPPFQGVTGPIDFRVGRERAFRLGRFVDDSGVDAEIR